MAKKPSRPAKPPENREGSITSVMIETRQFPPPAEFSSSARVGSMREYRKLRKQAADDPETFWQNIADELVWLRPWKKLQSGRVPAVKWFVGGRTNMSYNALDRHVDGWRRTK